MQPNLCLTNKNSGNCCQVVVIQRLLLVIKIENVTLHNSRYSLKSYGYRQVVIVRSWSIAQGVTIQLQ